jgi:hypothetical protein
MGAGAGGAGTARGTNLVQDPGSMGGSNDHGGGDRRETQDERLDRNLDELLQELRVAQTGVQVLFAFLLTVPFTQRWGEVTPFQRSVYFTALLCATGAVILLVAPTAYHRIVFRQHDKEAIVFISNWLAVLGLLLVAAAMTAVVLLITDVIYSRERAYLVAAVTGAIFGALWCLFPLARRVLTSGGDSEG